MQLERPSSREEAVAALGTAVARSPAAPSSCRCCRRASSRPTRLVDVTGRAAARGHGRNDRSRYHARRARGRSADPGGAPRGVPARRLTPAPQHGHDRRQPAPGNALLVLAPRFPVLPARRRSLPRARRASTASTRSSATSSAPRRIRPTLRRLCSRSARASAPTGASSPIAELYRLPTDDDRSTTTLEPGELILELDVPEVESSVYLKAMDRKRWAFALVGVAAARVGGETRIALSGAAPDPVAARVAWRRCGDAAAGNRVQGRDRRARSSTAPSQLSRSATIRRPSAACACSSLSLPAAATTTAASRQRRLRSRPPATWDGTRRRGARAEAGRRRAAADGRARSGRRPTASSSRRTAAPSRSSSTRRLAPKTAASLVALARERLLRRHDLPPGRARLRDPGRRPDRHRQRRPRLQDRRRAARDAAYTEGRRRDGEERGTEAPGTAGQPVLRRHGRRRRACRRSTPSSARSRTGWRRSMRSTRSASATGRRRSPS